MCSKKSRNREPLTPEYRRDSAKFAHCPNRDKKHQAADLRDSAAHSRPRLPPAESPRSLLPCELDSATPAVPSAPYRNCLWQIAWISPWPLVVGCGLEWITLQPQRVERSCAETISCPHLERVFVFD